MHERFKNFSVGMDVRLATLGGKAQIEALKDWEKTDNQLPSILHSYFYLDNFLKMKDEFRYRDWVMDSGAFSAFNSGKKIELARYIDVCHNLMSEDKTLVEIYSLDVIGDHKQSLKNCDELWRNGIPAIPCYHVGEPWDVLTSIAKDYPKIAIGGSVGLSANARMAWCRQVFARVYPCRVHGFGIGGGNQILSLPWHSVDATSWCLQPQAFGQWKMFGGSFPARGKLNIRSQVEWYLRLERIASARWAKQLDVISKTKNTRSS